MPAATRAAMQGGMAAAAALLPEDPSPSSAVAEAGAAAAGTPGLRWERTYIRGKRGEWGCEGAGWAGGAGGARQKKLAKRGQKRLGTSTGPGGGIASLLLMHSLCSAILTAYPGASSTAYPSALRRWVDSACTSCSAFFPSGTACTAHTACSSARRAA